MDQPVLNWHRQEWRLSAPVTGTTAMPAPFNPLGDGWFIENANPRPIVIERLQIVAHYKRWFGGPIDRELTLENIRLSPEGQYKVRPRRAPAFSSLLSHTLSIVISYGNSRYRLDNYRHPNLFGSTISLTLRFFDRVWG